MGKAMLCLGVLWLSSPLLAQEKALEENSPFLPPNFGKQAEEKTEKEEVMQGPVSQAVEFRSMIKIGDEWNFSLYDIKEQKSVWISQSAATGPFKIEDISIPDKRIQLTMNGKTEWLAMKTPSNAAAKGTPAATAPQPPTNTNVQQQRSSSGRIRLNRDNIPRRRVVVPTRQTEGQN